MSRSSHDTKNPPRWLDRFLEFYCRKDKVEDLQGDLYEYFYRNLDKGYRYATFIYFIDVLKFLRIYTVKQLKITTNMNFLYLFQNYFKTAVRSLQRNKLFSFINIAGLSISMSVAILLLIYVSDLLTYDHFHEKKDRIVRLTSSVESQWRPTEPSLLASTWIGFGPELMRKYDGLEHQVTLMRSFSGQVFNGEDAFSVNGHYASEDFFKVFSFQLLEGDVTSALVQPRSIVLTKSVADKIFGNLIPVGDIIKVNGESWLLSAIVEDPPSNSHLKFEALASLATHIKEAESNDEEYDDWSNMWMYHTYLLLQEKGTVAGLQTAIDQIVKDKSAALKDFVVRYKTQVITDIVPGYDYSNEIGETVAWDYIYILVGLSLLITLAACFNYTNLSIARSLRRSKEVGIRKVIGATRAGVITQFVTEAVVTALISAFCGYFIYLGLKDFFIDLISSDGGSTQTMTNMTFRPYHLLLIIVFALFTGLLAGIIPALTLARFNAITVMKDVTAVKLSGGVNLRRALIIFQFVLSITFIITAIVISRQYIYSINYDIGVETKNILNISGGQKKHEMLINRFKQIPAVARVSRSTYALSTGNMWSANLKHRGENGLDSFQVFMNYVDSEFLSMHGLKFLAGEPYPQLAEGQTRKYVVVNNLLAQKLGFSQPEEAIGKTVTFEGLDFSINGVTEDFQHATVLGGKDPFLFLQNSEQYYNLNVSLKTNDNLAAISKLEEVWEEIVPEEAFEPVWYADNVKKTYSQLIATIKIVGFVSFLVIVISSLGLLGIAVFTSETRMKEISIRKVMGASDGVIAFLLTKSYLILLFVAALIGMPLAYYVCEEMLLVNYINRIDIRPLDFFAGVAMILLVGALTIGWQVLATARRNPANTLRDE